VPARTVGRIQTRTAFSQLQRSRSRASSGPVRATFVPVEPTETGLFPQVGYAIGKQCGNAVVRNTLRRRMRESAQAVSADLPRGRYLLRAEPAAATRDRAQFSLDVRQALVGSSRSAKAER
jgi:ribonuclease P protein component